MFTQDELVEIREYLTDYRRHLENVAEDVEQQQVEWSDPDGCRLCGEQGRDYVAKRLADARKAIRGIGALLDKLVSEPEQGSTR